VSHYRVSPMTESPAGDSVPVLQSLPRHVDVSPLWLPHRPVERAKYKGPGGPRGLGAPPSLRNIKYTRMRYFKKEHSKKNFPEGPGEHVCRDPAVALDGPLYRLVIITKFCLDQGLSFHIPWDFVALSPCCREMNWAYRV